jgi:hypothetical protein
MDVGNWSKRRHKINERVSAAQSNSTVIGHTESYDDTLSIQGWVIALMSKVGQISRSTQFLTERDLVRSNQIEVDVVELAALCHSFLESLDRRKEREGGS